MPVTTITKLADLNDYQKIIIKGKVDGGTVSRVEAPLPDGFGMSVGSSFTDPQNIDLASIAGGVGALNKIAAPLASQVRRAGYSTKITSNTNIFYAGPEPTEISFEMNFNAYYSAREEVATPVALLMAMSVGRGRSFLSQNEEFPAILRQVLTTLRTEGVDVDEDGVEEDAADFGFIKRPPYCYVAFGRALTFKECFISSVGVKFSNVLDNEFLPMSASCAVTIKLRRNPVQDEIGRYFGRTD